MAIARKDVSIDFWAPKTVAAGVMLAIFATVGLAMYTRRIELVAVAGVPLALLLLSNYRLAATVATWVVLIWILRLPFVFFEVLQFSYVVYACVVLAVGAYVLRLGTSGERHLPLISNKWTWLLIATVVFSGVHGAQSVGSIPPWLLTGNEADIGVPWTYYRTVVLPGVLLPFLSVLIGASLCDKQKLSSITTPVWTFILVISALVIGQVATSGDALSVIATQRSEHLISLGFHSNELGAFLAIAYGLALGVWRGSATGRFKSMMAALLGVTAIALLLTFSRGAYLAFAVTNVVVFMGSSPKKRAAFLLLTTLLWLAAPAPVVDRVAYGLSSKDVNEISAGRVENLWLPLLPDVANHLWLGQGLQSIMWTDAQLFQQIYPVNHAHNAFLDLLLDLGVIGAIPVLFWYAHVWRELYGRAKTDPDPEFRALFFGGHLALLGFFLCALTNNRLTPTAECCVLWVVVGVVLGRARTGTSEPRREAVSEPEEKTGWRPLVREPQALRTRTIALDGV